MKTKQEILDKIKEVESLYSHVLTGKNATIVENAPRALMQLSSTAFLDGLYFVIGKTRPRYIYELKRNKE